MDVAFPPIYWINLDRAADRCQRMTRRFEERALAHTRVSAVDARRPQDMAAVQWSTEPAGGPVPCFRAIDAVEAAVVAAHLKAIKRAYEDGCAHAVIMEDDVTFELWDQWPQGWHKLQQALPVNYGIVQLCVSAAVELMQRLFLLPDLLVAVTDAHYASAAAYLIERDAMRLLLDAYDRGSHFDISSRSAPAEHVLFCGPVMTSKEFSGPFIMRVPLFIYEGEDSLIAEYHNDYLRPSRAFVLQHHHALVQESFTQQFPFLDELPRRPPPPPRAKLTSWLSSLLPAGTDGTLYSARMPYLIDAAKWRAFLSVSLPMTQRVSTRKEQQKGPRLIGIASENVEDFAARGLHKQRQPFVLLSHSVSRAVRSDLARRRILDHALCRGWFATHAFQETDARITPIPLGIDAMLAAERYGQLERYGPLVSADSLHAYAEQLKAYWQAIGDWAPSLETRVPIALIEIASNHPRDGLSSCVTRYLEHDDVAERWAFASRNAMFIAPLDGHDSSSIWSALLFGFVVAAPRWKRREHLGDLPIVWFDDPAEITESFVKAAMAKYRGGAHSRVLRYLSFGYWYEQMINRLLE